MRTPQCGQATLDPINDLISSSPWATASHWPPVRQMTTCHRSTIPDETNRSMASRACSVGLSGSRVVS